MGSEAPEQADQRNYGFPIILGTSKARLDRPLGNLVKLEVSLPMAGRFELMVIMVPSNPNQSLMFYEICDLFGRREKNNMGRDCEAVT